MGFITLCTLSLSIPALQTTIVFESNIIKKLLDFNYSVITNEWKTVIVKLI